MNAYALYDIGDDALARRWGVSALAVAGLHVALIALAIGWYHSPPSPGATLPAIMVDMSPATSAPQPTQLDLAPGPVMQQADAAPPEAARPEAVEEQIAPTPPQQKPDVVAPPERKPEISKPDSAKIVPEQKPAPAKPKVTRIDAKKPTEAPPAPRTTASPKAERQAQAASAVSSGASAAAVATYKQMVAAHLQRFKQYPPAAKAAGQQGVARINFTLGRGGQVLSASLGGSSGHAALDAETLAMVRRAQPFPAFPTDVKQSSMSFSAPVAFSVR